MSATMHAFAEMRYEETEDPTHFLVYSPSGNTYHVTNVGKEGVKPACSCQDHLMRGHACKHIQLVLSSAFTEKEHPMTEQSSGTGIFAALAAVYAKVERVEKDGQITQGGNYRFASESAFINAVRPAMVEAGLMVHVHRVRDVVHEVFRTSKGTEMNRVTLVATVRFVAKDGSWIEAESTGEGMDTGDKASNKAMTSAFKYALRQTFCLATGDDPDETSSYEQERGYRQYQPPRNEAPPGRVQQPSDHGPTNADVWTQFTGAMAAAGLTSSNLRPVMEPFGGFSSIGVKAALAAGETFESLFAMAKDNA